MHRIPWLLVGALSLPLTLVVLQLSPKGLAGGEASVAPRGQFLVRHSRIKTL
jgi:hypothetical protein